MKSIKSKKGTLTLGVFSFVWCILLIILLADAFLDNTPGLQAWPVHIVHVLVAFLLLWLWFDTSYSVAEGTVFFRSGPIKGRVMISDIRSIQVGKTQWVGIKPALAQKGLIVEYRKWDEVYFSSEDQQGFLDALVKQNPAIKLKY